jgi:hypothetical protein
MIDFPTIIGFQRVLVEFHPAAGDAFAKHSGIITLGNDPVFQMLSFMSGSISKIA